LPESAIDGIIAVQEPVAEAPAEEVEKLVRLHCCRCETGTGNRLPAANVPPACGEPIEQPSASATQGEDSQHQQAWSALLDGGSTPDEPEPRDGDRREREKCEQPGDDPVGSEESKCRRLNASKGEPQGGHRNRLIAGPLTPIPRRPQTQHHPSRERSGGDEQGNCAEEEERDSPIVQRRGSGAPR